MQRAVAEDFGLEARPDPTSALLAHRYGPLSFVRFDGDLERLRSEPEFVPYFLERQRKGWMALGLASAAAISRAVARRTRAAVLPLDPHTDDPLLVHLDRVDAEAAKTIEALTVLSSDGRRLLLALRPDVVNDDIDMHGVHGHYIAVWPDPALFDRTSQTKRYEADATETLSRFSKHLVKVERIHPDLENVKWLVPGCPATAGQFETDIDRYTGVTALDAAGTIASRHYRHPDNARTVDALVADLKAMGYCPTRHEFELNGRTLHNVVVLGRGIQAAEVLLPAGRCHQSPGSPGHRGHRPEGRLRLRWSHACGAGRAGPAPQRLEMGMLALMSRHGLAVVVALLASGCTNYGLQGFAAERRADGSTGGRVSGAQLRFVLETGGTVRTATTDANGSYSLAIAQGRYYASASHPDFEDYTSAPGFFLPANPRGIANFFLRAPAVTTVIIVRHAEKLDPNSSVPEEPLSPAGQARATQLAESLLRAGITAVYATDTVRTRTTVGALAKIFELPVDVYSDPAALATQVLATHRGDVVLVGAHSNTIAAVANAFGAQVPAEDSNDFDNVYVVSVAGNRTNVINLQYGADSTPDTTKNDGDASTFLLVGASSAGSLPQDLLHTARKAGVAAIFHEGVSNLVQPLATALNITPQTFVAGDIPTLVAQILSSHPTAPVVLAGSHDVLRAVIQAIGGYPTPVLNPYDTDHLIVVTHFASGETRAVSMRY